MNRRPWPAGAESNLPIIKIKLGSDRDEAMVAAIRGATAAKLRVDANAGWTRERAAQLIPRLKQYEIEFVEQPLAADDTEGLRWLKRRNLACRSLPTKASRPRATLRATRTPSTAW
jgi:L-alanine-DL-glutamate epimerase-like enolase superfamily enzyme